MEKTFDSLLASFEEEDSARNIIRERREVLATRIRKAQPALSALHTEMDMGPAAEVLRRAVEECGPALADIEKALPKDPGAFYKFCDLWYYQLHACVMMSVVFKFITDDTLADAETVKRIIDAEFQLPTESYLMGVCNAISELTRLSMNRVVLRDFDTPKRCVLFATNVFEAFKELNFRNGPLRKRYDGMKYDVKRLEEIIFDLKSFKILAQEPNEDT